MGRAMSAGLDHQVDIVAPFLTLAKADVIRLGTDLGVPFEYTMSCAKPSGGVAMRSSNPTSRRRAICTPTNFRPE